MKLLIISILKVIEVLSNSDKSWEDATKKVVKEASKTLNMFTLKNKV